MHLPPRLCCAVHRTVYTITQSSTGGGDVLAAAAAALAASAVAIKQQRPALSIQALGRARLLYDWAHAPALYNTTYCGTVTACRGAAVPIDVPWSAAASAAAAAAAADGGAAAMGPVAVEVPWVAYPSSSVLDDLAWAGVWLHRATGVCVCVHQEAACWGPATRP